MNKILVLGGLLALLPAAAAPAPAPAFSFYPLWERPAASAAKDGAAPIVAVSPQGTIVVSDGGGLFDPAGKALIGRPVPDLSDIEFTAEGALLAVVGDHAAFYKGGALVPAFKLPSSGMKIARGDEKTLYFYGPVGAQGYAVFKFWKGGDYAKWMEMKTPVAGVVDDGAGGIYLATENLIYHARPKKPLALVFAGKGLGRIESLARDPKTARLYFTSQKGLYSFGSDGTTRIWLTPRGQVAYSGGLYFMDQKAGKLYGVVEKTPPKR